MGSKPSRAVLLIATAAVATVAGAPASAGTAGSSATPGGAPPVGEERHATGAASDAAPHARAARRITRRAVATRRRGVRRISGVRVGPLTRRGAVPNLAQVRRQLGRPLSVRGGRNESCTVRWRGGLEMIFSTFGLRVPCTKRSLQTATLDAPRWRVKVGRRTYRVGMPRRRIPRNARHIEEWAGGGYELATMPFLGRRTTTVLAHLSNGRIDRFSLFIGGAGD